jgi:hypothetical protein
MEGRDRDPLPGTTRTSLHLLFKRSNAMNFLRLMWSFTRYPGKWLYLLSNYDHIWVPGQDEFDPTPKHRTMWGD